MNKNCLCVNVRISSVFLDKFAARSHIIAHQHGEDVVGFGCIFDADLLQNTGFRIHGGFPQLFRIHLSQTFVALGMDAGFGTVTVFFA